MDPLDVTQGQAPLLNPDLQARPARHRPWQRNRFVRQLHSRPRLFIATAIAIAVGVLLPESIARQAVTRWLIAWNVGTVLYVILAAIMMIRSSSHHMRHRAQQQDDGQRTILALVVIATVASLAAIGGELAVVKDMHGFNKGAHIALAGVTVLSSWTFIQIMFALHYAHDYYAAACHGRPPGLQFPEEDPPDYGDFFYFASVIGTSGQTADVLFVSKPLRRIGTLHCILSYLFNTTVLALLINIGASMF
ncbi:MAG: DUF1345 domain-containing protein [Pseudomonadota bacterium]|nr:DUF1345 domain-containing protein [Pseudomonadota bacterium]